VIETRIGSERRKEKNEYNRKEMGEVEWDV
jgi:hypothetical protein